MMQDDTVPAGENIRFWEVLAFSAYFLGLLAIGVYAWTQSFAQVFGILWVVATASWVSGTALGFLFGVPRVRTGEAGTANDLQTSVTPNTNLEQISDWLTKIIVGATLVQLVPIANGIGDLSRLVGSTLRAGEMNAAAPGIAVQAAGVATGGVAVSGGVIVLYFCAGFIWGYLWCSLRIFKEMQSLVKRERNIIQSEGTSAAPADMTA